ncbi:MAG: helix-turn-helix transcriptional regulator [Roseimicrobium sp.]
MQPDHNTTSPTSFLTAQELRKRWRVSAMFLWRLRRKGKLSAFKIGERNVRFSMAEVERIEAEAKA